MTETSRSERVILISIMKSGTHLITELMAALGYRMYGHVRVGPRTRPVLDEETCWRVAAMVYTEEGMASLKSQGEPAFNASSDRAWEALAWAWQLRFGMPLMSWYSAELINTDLVQQAYRRTANSSFADTPAGICWVLHDFDASKIDGGFLREWAETGEPRIIFNYRDPRDVILSMVNFLSGRTKEGLSAFNSLRPFSDILLAMPNLEERLTYALTDDSFPCHSSDFRRMFWLLNHPNVCKVSFEELVGPQGGGSAESQRNAVARLTSFLGASTLASENILRTLFNREAFSFYRGRIGAWREVFTSEHRHLADARFGDVLAMYRYTPTSG
jgi:hypothetical protein